MKVSPVLRLGWLYLAVTPLIVILLPFDSSAPKFEFIMILVGLSLLIGFTIYATYKAVNQGFVSPTTVPLPTTLFDQTFRIMVCIVALPPFLLGLLAAYENMTLSADETINIRIIGKKVIYGSARSFPRAAIVYEHGSETKQRKVTWSFYNEVDAGNKLEVKVTNFYGFWKEARLLSKKNEQTFYYIDRGRAAWPFLTWMLTFLASPRFLSELLKSKAGEPPSKTRYRLILGFTLFVLLIVNSILSPVYMKAL